MRLSKIYFFFLCLSVPFLSLSAAEPEIIVQNRILATVNGKNITVYDVMKKMELFLARSYPEESKSSVARFQFFSQNWRQILNQMVDNELILADAEKLQLKIPDAKVREIIHERFGPNVMATLDEVGLTFDEAWKMIYTEIAVQQVSWFRIYKKAQDKIGPQDIKVAFKNHLAENPPKEEWVYRVLAIRAQTEKLAKLYAQKAHALIRNEPIPFETLAKRIQEEGANETNISINVSGEYNVEDRELAAEHKNVLCRLTPGSYSEPVPQISRRDNSIVHRIFYLMDHKAATPPTFDSMVEKLMDDLVQKEIQKEYPPYLARIRKQFNFDEKMLERIPSDFQPFALK